MKALIAYRTRYLNNPEKELAAQRLAEDGSAAHDQIQEYTNSKKPIDGGSERRKDLSGPPSIRMTKLAVPARPDPIFSFDAPIKSHR